MDVKRIRAIVNEVNPPVKGKPMTLTKELSNEIAKTTPFWEALLRKRDIREAEGGDEYVTGLIETFSRIYTALKEGAVHGALAALDLDTLYRLDAELQQGDLGLLDEYPALEMAGVKELGSFGAGILMAYALLETALAILSDVDAPSTKKTATSPPQEDTQSIIGDLLTDLPEEVPNQQIAPASTKDESYRPVLTENPEPTQDKPANNWFKNWDFNNESVTTRQVPLIVLGIFPTEDGIVVRGDLPPTLSGAAQVRDFVKTIFNRDDADISMGARGLEFSFNYPVKGERS